MVSNYIPKGKITILQGDGGIGKTNLACKFTACVSRGAPIQDSPCEMGNVLVLSVDDTAGYIRGKLEVNGADLNKCLVIKDLRGLDLTSIKIWNGIRKQNIKMVIFDPLVAFLGKELDIYNPSATDDIATHLSAMAKQTGCAILITSYVPIAAYRSIYRVLGFSGLKKASSSILEIGKWQDKGQRVMHQRKTDNGKGGKPILFRIGDRGYIDIEP